MIDIQKLNLDFRHFAIKDINLSIGSGDYFMLVGPTGAGKTLLLETIAGLHKPKIGTITIDGEDITALEPEKRNIGMVYQDCALFPHLSVAQNIVFGLNVRHVTQNDIKKELDEIGALVNVGHLLDRKPGKLSGGEKQKVALARALAIKPAVLLLDEPLSALDPETREGLQKELKRIHAKLDITVIHVTHDFDEAMILGNRIAVMGAGSIRQTGTPQEIFRQPDSEFVARFTMMRNIMPGELIKKSSGPGIFRAGRMELLTAAPKAGATHACIRPEDITLSTDIPFPEGENSFTGVITGIEDRGMAFHVNIDVPPELCCSVSHRNFKEMGLAIGQKVRLTLNPDAVHVF